MLLIKYYPANVEPTRHCATGCRRFMTSFFSVVGEKRLLRGHKVRYEVMGLVVRCWVFLGNNNGHLKRQNDSEVKLYDVKKAENELKSKEG